MKTPNFFIIGAPKCGTTSVASWLASHNAVLMSPVKEPHHYSKDISYSDYRSKKKYLSLFDDAERDHIAIGEASVWYLFSKIAIPNIEDDVVNPKYILMLRNPLEMAPSLHQQLFFQGDENIKLFNEAWDAQLERAKGKLLPKLCMEPKFLQYGEVCSLGRQLERLLSLVPRKRILPVLLDDIKDDPNKTWIDIQSFLEIPHDNRKRFPVENKAKELRWIWPKRINDSIDRFRCKLKLPPIKTGFSSYFNKKVSVTVSREPLSKEMQQALASFFYEDIKLLEKYIQRDLTNWTNPNQLQ